MVTDKCLLIEAVETRGALKRWTGVEVEVTHVACLDAYYVRSALGNRYPAFPDEVEWALLNTDMEKTLDGVAGFGQYGIVAGLKAEV